MTVKRGLLRLWIAASAILLVLSVLQTMRNPDKRDIEGFPRLCVPFLITKATSSKIVGYLPPHIGAYSAQQTDQKQLLNSYLAPLAKPKDGIDRFIDDVSRKPQPIIKQVSIYTCSSWNELVTNLIKALAISILILGGFFVSRWIISGFWKSS